MMFFRLTLLLTCLSLATGCAPARSTRMTAEDLSLMATHMAASLAASAALRDRSADSPPWIVSVQKVTNLTSDVMTEGEQWYVIQKLRSSLPIMALRDQRNIRFVLPAQRVQELRADPDVGREVGDFDRRFGSDRAPTHVMTAVFRSVTRAVANERTELYYCEFEIQDLASGTPVWTDRFEYKRIAIGHEWD